MTRLKWLWWKFWAWLTKPWTPEDRLGNPRAKKRRGDPEWMLGLVLFMRLVNVGMLTLIIVSLLALYLVSITP